jgi:RHS repeat-associated protein
LVSTITNAPNLAFNSVQPPSSVHVGDLIAIPFSVTNVSGTAAPGGWHDAVYLSLDNTLGPEDIRLGAVQRVTPLAGNATIAGVLTAPIPRMPTGTYRVLVVADADAMIPDLSRADNIGLSSGTIEVSIETNPLVLSQKTLGYFATGLSIDRWTFTGMAGQQVRLDTIATAPNKALYTLTGPSGFTGFSDLSADSEFIDLPHTGPYTLEVRSASGVGSSSYSFQLNETSQTLLALETDYVGNLAGTGMAQMFQVTLPGTDPLQIRFDGSVSADNVEVYAKFGSPPNRQSFDVRNSLVGADHVLQVPVGVPGKLFVLVYAQQVAATMPFTLRVDRTEVIVSDVSPAFIAAGVLQAVTVSGLGFTPGSIVELIPTGGGSPILGSSVKILSADKLSAVFTLPQATAGTFDARVTLPNGASNTLQAGVIVQPGQAKLETRIIATLVPCCGTATLYVEYANTGTTTMPAPILTLSSADPANPADTERPYFSLDQTIVVEGFWTSAIPDGFSERVDFLASGESVGWLQPGERMLMPVYYIGMQPPREIFDGFFDLAVGSVEAGDPTPIPWAELEAELRPSSISIEAWPTIFDNLQAQMGSTLGDYHQTILDNAVYLGRLGQRVADAAQLLGFELQQAIGIDYVGPIATAVDASVPAPGLSLEFPRSFGNSIAEHYQIGPFGRGWTSDWHRSLETLTDGTIVFHQSADIQRRFQPDRRTAGAYLSETGITVKLRKLSSGLYELIKANGEVTRFHPDGRLDQVRDANGNTITAGYAGNQLIGLTHSSGDALSIEYNDAGRIASVTDSRGRVTSYTYDASNTHLMSVTDVRGTATYQYSLGQGAAREHALTSVTDPSGVERHFEYDASGRLAATSLANNVERITFAYDSAGQVTRTAQDGVQTSLYFDTFGSLVRVEDGDGFYVNSQYVDEFRSVQLNDALGRTESSEFTKAGGLQTIVDANYQQTRFTSGGPLNQPKSFIDALGNVTNYTFDAAGNVTATAYPDFSVEQTVYDAHGNPDLITNRRGQVVDLTFNNAGKVTRQLRSDGTLADFTYDARGRLETATDSRGATTFTYDSADRLTRVEYPGARWLQYQYDATGRRTRLEDHTGHVTQYAYDAAGRLHTVRGPGNALLVQYTYDVTGRVAREDKGNGTFTEYVYDIVGRTASITHRTPGGAVSAKIDYSYDLSGRVSTMTTPDGMWTYSYDLTDQLVHAVFAATNAAIAHQDLSYEYDALGNRVRTIVNGATTDYSTNGMNQIVSAGATTYTYDLDGNLTQESGPGGTRQYTYDSRNRLTGAQTPEGVWQYEYDVLGNRSAVIMNGQRTEYLIDPTGLGEVAAEFSPSGTLNARYSRGLGLVGREDENGAASFYNFDSLGSTVQLTGAAGAIQNTYAYQPFGEALHATGAASNPFTFVGALGVMQEGNGLYFMRARFYSPTQGRFTQQDPIRLNGRDTNLYRYVANSPANGTDASGLITANEDYCEQVERGLVNRGTDGKKRCLYPVPDRESCYSNGGDYYSGTGGRGGACSTPFLNEEYSPNPPGTIHRLAPTLGILKLPSVLLRIVSSIDPNEKFGASGFGPQSFIDGETPIPYSVHFENLGPGSKPTPTQPATAPAQRIEITDQLSIHLDWNTFEFSEFGFGDTVISVQATNYSFTAVPVPQNGHDFVVEVELNFDATTGKIRVVFQAIDPATSLPPDALLGILPPEDGSGNGQGYFNYQVLPKAGLATGTEIRNIALITFDANAAIATNQIDPQNPAAGFDPAKEALNTIDADGPSSVVLALVPTVPSPNFNVSWTGDDAGGSGVRSYDVFVSINAAPFVVWLLNTIETSAIYQGDPGRAYAFYSVATDNVGHRESAPTIADAHTTVAPLLGDFNGDGMVGLLDIVMLQSRIGASGAEATQVDLNGDGSVDRGDAAILTSVFGSSVSSVMAQASPNAIVRAVVDEFSPGAPLAAPSALVRRTNPKPDAVIARRRAAAVDRYLEFRHDADNQSAQENQLLRAASHKRGIGARSRVAAHVIVAKSASLAVVVALGGGCLIPSCPGYGDVSTTVRS